METVIAHSNVRRGEDSPAWVSLSCRAPSDVEKIDDHTLALSTPNAIIVRFFVQKDGVWVEDPVRTVDYQYSNGARKITLVLTLNDPCEQELRYDMLMLKVGPGEYVGVYELLPDYAE